MATKGTKRKKAASAAPSKTKRPATSLLDAAAAILAKSKTAMACPEMVEAVLAARTWKGGGKTPAATLSAAIHREIRDKGKEARFAKSERGRFRLTATGRRST